MRPAGVKTSKTYPGILRLVTALVTVDDAEREMTFVRAALWVKTDLVGLWDSMRDSASE